MKDALEEKRKEKKWAGPPSPSLLCNTVYQRIELTLHIGPQSVYESRALCIIVLQSQGSVWFEEV